MRMGSEYVILDGIGIHLGTAKSIASINRFSSLPFG
jgi:hypothetical protein